MGRTVRTVALTGSDQTVRSTEAIYCGFTVRETTGAEATVQIYDGTSASGTLIDSIQLAADESAREFYEAGIWVTTGIYVDVTGAVEGSIRIG